jgi:DNA-binding transcriptional LysR family regulator
LHERLPGLDVGLDVGVNSVVMPRLFAGELDLVIGALPDIGALPPGIERRDFLRIELRVVAGRHHPLHARRRVTVTDLAEFPWVLYQHDRDVMDHLAQILQRGGAAPPRIRVETTSLLAVIQLLRTGPYLACMADALLRAAPEPDIAIVPYPRGVWTFPSGALFHTAVRDFAPIRTLLELVSREASAASERGGRRRTR